MRYNAQGKPGAGIALLRKSSLQIGVKVLLVLEGHVSHSVLICLYYIRYCICVWFV